MPYKIYHFKTLTSTNDKAKELLEKGERDFVVAAEMQTKGRGRFKRKWHSAKEGLWFSIGLKPEFMDNIQYLTFLASIAAVKSIRKIAKIDAKIKWPNDIHCGNKKLCGILTEVAFGKENAAVIGIGININQKKFPKDIESTATSLKIATGKNFDKDYFLKDILIEFEKLYGVYKNKKFNEIADEWRKCSDTLGRIGIVVTKNGQYHGRAFDIDNECNLLLELNDGKIVKIAEGDLIFNG